MLEEKRILEQQAKALEEQQQLETLQKQMENLQKEEGDNENGKENGKEKEKKKGEKPLPPPPQENVQPPSMPTQPSNSVIKIFIFIFWKLINSCIIGIERQC